MLNLHLQNSVRTGTISIGSSLPTSPTLKSLANKGHNILYLKDLLLSQTNNVDVVFGILSALDFLLAV